MLESLALTHMDVRMIKFVLACLIFLQAPLALADAEGQINYRQGVYKSVGGHMSSIMAILRQGVYGDNLAFHANAMKDLAGVAPTVFPEGSDVGKTDALAAIWEEPEEFQAAMDKFVTAANGFAAAAESGDRKQIGGAIQALGGSCKGCHDNYKAD